jgi:beta-phosphoglucomutase-like phosphatase (HAD superfamily)
MIEAMIFDLDGTLVQTEKLKAISYARAVAELCTHPVPEGDILEAYKQVVGQSRSEVARHLVSRFRLEFGPHRDRVEFRGLADWQILVQVRLARYGEMLSDPGLLLSHRWPYNLQVLEEARRQGCKTALATMSSAAQTREVLGVLGLEDEFNFIATRDDVDMAKPDPEIYLLLMRELEVEPTRCLVLEDSPAGITAAQAAGAWVIAVTTPFTYERVHQMESLDQRWIVDAPEQVLSVVHDMLSGMRAEE